MTRPSYFVALMLLLSTSVLMTSNAYAERVEPTGRDTPVTATFDKTAPPPQVNIWTKESGGYDTNDPNLWSRNSWTCLSNSDPETGECRTSPAWGKDGDIGVPLTFTEKRSGLKQVINIQTEHRIVWVPGSSCGTEYNYYPSIDGAEPASCEDGRSADGSQLTAYFESAELARFPVGGIWQAEFKVVLTQWDPQIKLADWNAHITLNVTDNNNQQIYLPEFGQAAPSVDLNLRPLSGSGSSQAQMSGAANIDMCLYDGYGANSSSFTVKLDDQPQGSLSRNKDDFSLYADGGDASLISNRIDYQVAMQLPNANTLKVMRGQDNVISDIASAQVRSVYLPGIPQAVLCVPTPLTLSTKNISIISKQAGHYTGHLIVTFTPQL